MRPIWRRLNEEDGKKKKDNVVAKSSLKKIIAKFLTKAMLKFLPYIAVGLVGAGAIPWAIDILVNGRNNPEYVYEVIGGQDLNELIAIAGNEEDGYYLAYKEGLDEKLDKIVENYKDAGYQYVNKDILLKMIQAELYTQYPNLGGKIGHEAKVDETTATSGVGGTLKWPTSADATISSEFGLRDQPTAGASTNHKGIDIAVSEGTEVYACASGKVITATYDSGA